MACTVIVVGVWFILLIALAVEIFRNRHKARNHDGESNGNSRTEG